MKLRHTLRLFERYETEFDGIRNQRCQVYRNPTAREYRELQQYDNVRAFLLPNDDILVWNPFQALHFTVREHMKLDKMAIPMIIAGGYRSYCYVTITDASEKTPIWHNPEVARMVKNSRTMRRMFTSLDVDYYDEDIVGPWDRLTPERE